MKNLSELYAKRKVFEDYGADIPDSLANEIKEAERELLDNALDTFTGHLPCEIEMSNFDKIVFAAKYEDGKLVHVASSDSLDLADIFESVKNVSEDDEAENGDSGEEESADDDPENGRKRGPSIGFTVKFADGKIIKYSTARRTMIESLRYMGLERASRFRGEMFKGYPLIGKEQRPTEPRRTWQKNIDGWWIYVNMDNNRAIACLNGVAKLLCIEMEIILDEESDKTFETTTSTSNPKGKRRLFSINGSQPLVKNRAVYEAVCLFIQQFPDATFTDVEQMFPKSLQGSYGVIRSLEDIRQRGERNRTESSRWFLEPEEILTASDGIRFAVSTEWGDNFDEFKKHIESSFGWTVEEA